MRYLVFSEPEREEYSICFLVPVINKADIHKAYLENSGINQEDVLVLDLHYTPGKKKTPMKEMRAYIEEELAPILLRAKVQYIVCCDAEYFKALTKEAKTEANLGYLVDSEMGPWKVVYVPNHKAIFYDPEKVTAKIQQGLQALTSTLSGSYEKPGTDIIQTEYYPKTYDDIKRTLEALLKFKSLTCDIEAFSLKHVSAGIGTITFCWNKHEGVAFAVDYKPHSNVSPNAAEFDGTYGSQVKNEPIRKLLRWFFVECFLREIKLTYHSIGFDVTILIYQLFMDDILDRKNMLYGLEVMMTHWDCTKLITYLATNSCSGNRLGLKDQAQEYCGNYAMDSEDIKDIRRIPLPKLLQYNLVDGLGTWYTYEKHWDTLVADDQLEIYNTLFKPSMVDIIEMQLTGMPVNMEEVKRVDKQLTSEINIIISNIQAHPIIQQFTKEYLNVKYAEKMNEKWVKKRIEPQDAHQVFNPNSDPQMRALFFDWLKLDVINRTASKKPSTDGETIEALLNRVTNPSILDLLGYFQQHAIISILTTNFIPALLGSVEGPDGWHYLFGNFNLGGTLSGRLSSSGPNLQNLPSTAKGNPKKLKYAKLIKGCFQAPPGWLFGGVDFSSLEDRISALSTKDPNKLKVYTDGYDGHSLRAFAYFKEDMPDIIDTVESINTVQKKYKPLRDRSKNPTFTLTYQGTWIALVKKYGFSIAQAKEVEARYHELYKVSDDWVFARLDAATRDGYITAAFGLRVRTPLLKQVIRGTTSTPYEAEAEGRTAGNALGQSWCLLNSRAGNEFNAKVRHSSYSLDIRPCAQIHDAQYHLIRDDVSIVAWVNEHLVKAVQWQDHPEIAHDDVKLGGEFGIFYPNWNTEITIPNGAKEDEIISIINKAITKE